MHRLIYAELKKNFLNKRTVVSILLTMVLAIGLTTLIYSETTRYMRPRQGVQQDIIYEYEMPGGYPSGSSSLYVGQKGADAVTGILQQMGNAETVLQSQIDSLETIKDVGIKKVLKENLNKLLAYSMQIIDIIEALPSWNGEDAEQYEAFIASYLAEDGAHYAAMAQLKSINYEVSEINKHNNMLQQLVFFKKPDYNNYDYTNTPNYYQNIIANGFYGIQNVIRSYEVALDYYQISIEFPDDDRNKDYYMNEFSNLIYYIENAQKIDIDLNFSNYVSNYKLLIDEAISLSLTQEVSDRIDDFVMSGEVSIQSRLEDYYADVEQYRNILSLTKEDVSGLNRIATRYSNMKNISEQYINNYLYLNSVSEFTDNQLDDYEVNITQNKYGIKKYVTAAEYIVKNNLHAYSTYNYGSIYGGYAQELLAEGYSAPGSPLSLSGLFGNMMGDTLNMYTYISFIFSVLSLVIITLCIVLGGGAIAGEQSKGTIKMLMIRPYKRWKILTAKILTTLIVSIGLTIASVIVLMLLGALLFGYGLSAVPVFAVFNASRVVIMSAFGELILKILMMIVSLIIYTMIATLFSTVLKSKSAAVCVALVLNIAGTILSFSTAGVGWLKYFIFNNSDLYMYWGGGPSFGDMSFVFSAIICAVYVAVFGFITYWLFTKRDLN